MLSRSALKGEATFPTILSHIPSHPFIIYAARLRGRPGWHVGALKGQIDDVKRWYAQAGDVVLEVRQLGEPLAQASTLVAEWRAQALGWFKDRPTGIWHERQLSDSWEPSSPEVCEGLAVSFSPPESGWIKGAVAIACPGGMACFWISNLYGPEPHIVPWLEEIARGGYPRITFAKERSWREFLVLPGDHLKEREHLQYPEPEFVRFCIVRRWPSASTRELDVLLPRLTLVRAIYRAWLSCHDDDPQRFRDEWTTFGESELTPEYPFQRSDFLERWMQGDG